jgi:hypothetical protein
MNSPNLTTSEKEALDGQMWRFHRHYINPKISCFHVEIVTSCILSFHVPTWLYCQYVRQYLLGIV